MLIKREKTSHWYTTKGEPFYETKRAKGDGMRAVTIRDARKIGALPSVTNILSVLSKPGLEAWKQEQCILSALTTPRLVDEPEDAFAKRVVLDSQEEARVAADKGTQLHDAASAYACNGTMPPPELVSLFTPFKHWFDDTVVKARVCEEVVVCERHWFAGRLDLLAEIKGGRTAVFDFKSQGNANGKFLKYPEWPLQLSAYHAAVNLMCDPVMMNVIIGRDEPAIEVVEYDRADTERYFETFLAAYKVWKYQKNYDPCPKL